MPTPRLIACALLAAAGISSAASIDAVYFGQTHLWKPDHLQFGLVGERECLIKAHVTDPATPASPVVTAVLSLGGQTLNLPLNGPATLPAAIPDGLGVVQHSFADSFTATIPSSWMKTGLQVTVTAGPASVNFTNLKVGAPTKVVMTMFDVQYFADTNGDYPVGWQEEIEAKWPVADLDLRRVPHVVFRELVVPPRAGLPAVRVSSPADYQTQTGSPFDGEQAAALAWNGALKRAAGRGGRTSLYYTNIYGANAGGQAGSYAGVGNGTSAGILHHELGHALSLPHWGDSASYPYKGDMHGILAPDNYNGTHAGPVWAYEPRTQTFIPPTVQPGNVGNRPTGTYKVDPMQGGGTGSQEPGFLLNHFSDYSAFQMRGYLHSHVLVWNQALNSYASWNQGAGAYTSTVSNNGVQYPLQRDAQVITVMASISGAKPDVNMVYPPIGPYTAGLIRLFDPRVAADRSLADFIYAPDGGCDLSLRVIQGGVEKIYMLAAPWEPGVDPLAGGSLKTEAINLPAADGPVTLAELLLTPDAEINGLPANPQVLSTWAPVVPDPAGFAAPPLAGNSSSISMTATTGSSGEGPVEYLFTETSGNAGGSSSAWQSSPNYTDIGLQPSTTYSYTVTLRAGASTGRASAAAPATTPSAGLPGNVTFDGFVSTIGNASIFNFAFNASGSQKLVVVATGEHNFNQSGSGAISSVTYDGQPLTRAVYVVPNSAYSSGLKHGDTVTGIWYLDRPGEVHAAGNIAVSVGGNGQNYVYTALGLSGTAPGAGSIAAATVANSLQLTTSSPGSLVISSIGMGGSGNTATPLPGVSATSPPAVGTNTVTFTGLEAGSNWAGHAVARSSGLPVGVNTFTFDTTRNDVVTIAAEFLAAEIPATDYQIWSSQFPAADLADPAGDFDRDGVLNSEERIWGLDPTKGGSLSPVVTAPRPADGTFTYTRRRSALTGLAFAYEWSSTLKTGEWFPFTPVGEAIQTAGDVETVTATLPAGLLGETRLFVRVVAE